MQRFYSASTVSGDKLSISDPDQVHHIRDVLRMKTGERLAIFNGTGMEYMAEIANIGSNSVQVKVVAVNRIEDVKGKLAIACALPKLGRMDEVVDVLTQIGVDIIIPMVTERTIVRLDEAGKEARLVRWRKIATAAAMQSHRINIPEVMPVSSFNDVIKRSSQYELRLIATLCAGTVPIHDTINMAREGHILALIGPEGDFTSHEVKIALDAGFIPVSLGRNVLRVATAAMATAAYIVLSRARTTVKSPQ